MGEERARPREAVENLRYVGRRAGQIDVHPDAQHRALVELPRGFGEVAFLKGNALRPAEFGDVPRDLCQRAAEVALLVVGVVRRGEPGEGIEDLHRDAEFVAAVTEAAGAEAFE